jgi:WD40 repeat protein
VTSVAASDSGDRLFATATHLHCWRMGERVPKAGWVTRATEPGLFWAVAASPDGDRLAVTAAPWTRSAELALYDARSGERVAALVPDYFHRGGPLRWSPDGTTLAAVAHCDLALFDAADGRRAWRVRAGGRQAFTALAFHPSGRSLLLGCYDGTARLYDVASGREVRSFAWPLGKVLSVAFAPDGTLAAAGGDKGQVVVWDVDD